MADADNESVPDAGLHAPPSVPPPGRAAILIIAVVTAVYALHWAQAVIVPIVLAGLIGYALDPLHRRIIAIGVPRAVSAALVLLLTLGGLVAAGAGLRGQAVAFINTLPAAAQRVHALMSSGGSASDAVVTVQQAARELKAAADQAAPERERGVTRVQIEEPALRILDLVWQGSLGAIALAAQATIILFLVYYVLAGGDSYKRKLMHVAGPSLTRRRLALEILNEVNSQVERFLVARLLISLMVGVATGLAFWALGVPQPAIWGVGAGICNTVPYIGPTLIAAAAFIIGLAEFHTVGMAALLGGVCILIASVEGLLIAPWLMGRAGRMNPGAVFVGLIFWGWIWGVSGLLLAVPILMLVKSICDHTEGGSTISELLSK